MPSVTPAEVSKRPSLGDFEQELPLAQRMREDLEYVLSQCLYSMRLEIFHRELPNMKGEQALKLKECHQKLISDLTTKMQDTIQDLFFETEIVESLNELNQLIDSEPMTFDTVWRPSGNPKVDMEPHMKRYIEKYMAVATFMLNKVRSRNQTRKAQIEHCEQEIISLKESIRKASIQLEERGKKLVKRQQP